MDDRDEIHRKATAHLKEAAQFAEFAHNDRESRVPKLTPEQDEQLTKLSSVCSRKFASCISKAW